MRDRDEIWTPEEIAERWKISARTVRDMLARGEIKGFKVRREWRVYFSDVLTYKERPQKIEVTDLGNVVAMMPRAVITKIRSDRRSV